MKIIQVSAIDTTMNGLLRELNEQTLKNGHELICVCSDGPFVAKLRSDGYDVRTINIDRQINMFSNLKSIREMFFLFKKEKPDIVHVHTPIAALLGRIAAKMAKVPNIVYTAHGFYFHENMNKWSYKLFYNIEKYAARWLTDYLFTQSSEDGELAIADNFLPKERISIIGNGVDVEGKFNPDNIRQSKVDNLKKELKINKDDIVITFIGRLVREKGIFDLLNAFKDIKISNIKLLIVGETTASERDQETKNEIKNYDGIDNVIFTGYRTDIPEILLLTDIYCLPSYREGMPRSIIEAMSMNCAIIATDIRGSREEVDHDKNGYLVELGNISELKNTIETLCDDAVKIEKFKYKARFKALNKFNEKKVVENQLRIFESFRS